MKSSNYVTNNSVAHGRTRLTYKHSTFTLSGQYKPETDTFKVKVAPFETCSQHDFYFEGKWSVFTVSLLLGEQLQTSQRLSKMKRKK